MERRKPLARMSAKRRNTGPTTTVRALVHARSGGLCEWPGCPRPGTDLHHRLNRKQGGRHGEMRDRINGAAWLLEACRPHHERVTSPVGEVRVAVEQLGWVLREHQDAEVTPVFTRHGWVLLTPDGGFETYSPNHTPPTGGQRMTWITDVRSRHGHPAIEVLNAKVSDRTRSAWTRLIDGQCTAPAVTIEWSDDIRHLEVHVNGEVVVTATYNKHGRSVMDAVERTALAVAKACGARVDRAQDTVKQAGHEMISPAGGHRAGIAAIIHAASAWRDWYVRSLVRMQDPSDAEQALIDAIAAARCGQCGVCVECGRDKPLSEQAG